MFPSSVHSSDNEQADVLNTEDDEGWEDLEADLEKVKIVSLLDDEVFDDVASMLLHCKAKHSFEFLKLQRQFSE